MELFYELTTAQVNRSNRLNFAANFTPDAIVNEERPAQEATLTAEIAATDPVPVENSSMRRRRAPSREIKIELLKTKFGAQLVEWALDVAVEICSGCLTVRSNQGIYQDNHTGNSCPRGLITNDNRNYLNRLYKSIQRLPSE
jgi:hypothetical protein